MPDVTAKNDRMKSQTTDLKEVSGIDNSTVPTLDACYGQIGISAVAAAARYQGVAKNPAYAPASNEWRHQYVEDPA
jgi:hypothetical protein